MKDIFVNGYEFHTENMVMGDSYKIVVYVW